jgi:uncharacterized membrane-anchored protein YjiN (DUF445 family)
MTDTSVASPPLMAGDREADAVRLSRLRRMKLVALSLLLLAAVVYVVTRNQDGFWGYVNAGAEASMVGAMADWFAVTALFRHPLGLPVPHTALVPKRKDDFGRSLEEFFAENFLQEQVIRDRLTQAAITGRLGTWLADPAHAARVVREVSAALVVGLRRLKDDDVEAVVKELIIPRFVEEPIAPVAGGLLQEIVADGAHHGLVDLVLDEAHHWLVFHQETFSDVVGERAPWWSPDRLNDAVTNRLHLETVRWVADIRADPEHRARRAFDSFMSQLAQDLLNDPDTQERAEKLKRRLLEQPQTLATGMSLWSAFRRALAEALDDAEGPLRERATQELVSFGERIGTDAALRERLDVWLADFVVWAVDRYGEELASVITATIARWDGQEAARRIELHVGRDLQFIRINGTIVGGLVGVLIHAASALL